MIPLLPLTPIDAENPQQINQRQLITSITVNEILKGRMNVTGTLTLTESSTTTVVLDDQFQSDQLPLLVPTTANAAAAMAGIYVSARDNGTFTLTHASTATLDRTFLYARIG